MGEPALASLSSYFREIVSLAQLSNFPQLHGTFLSGISAILLSHSNKVEGGNKRGMQNSLTSGRAFTDGRNQCLSENKNDYNTAVSSSERAIRQCRVTFL